MERFLEKFRFFQLISFEQALQRKLDDVDSDMRIDDSRIKTLNALADKLVRQGRSDGRIVQQRRDLLNHRWRSLQGALEDYRQDLAGALEIHAFNRDVDDTEGRITEKIVLLSVDDMGQDLAQVTCSLDCKLVRNSILMNYV